MRRFLLAACLVLAAFSASAELRARLPAGVRGAFGAAGFPVQLLLMGAKEADRELALPVRGVRAAQVKDTWHAPRGGGRRHEGQDIFARRGTEVLSATEGYVVRVGENALGGRTVFVLGPGGRTYYYAHLDSYAPGLRVGDYVTAGTPLGRVGDTGNAKGTPPHLHFGVYTAAGAVDPLPLLADRE